MPTSIRCSSRRRPHREAGRRERPSSMSSDRLRGTTVDGARPSGDLHVRQVDHGPSVRSDATAAPLGAVLNLTWPPTHPILLTIAADLPIISSVIHGRNIARSLPTVPRRRMTSRFSSPSRVRMADPHWAGPDPSGTGRPGTPTARRGRGWASHAARNQRLGSFTAIRREPTGFGPPTGTPDDRGPWNGDTPQTDWPSDWDRVGGPGIVHHRGRDHRGRRRSAAPPSVRSGDRPPPAARHPRPGVIMPSPTFARPRDRRDQGTQ